MRLPFRPGDGGGGVENRERRGFRGGCAFSIHGLNAGRGSAASQTDFDLLTEGRLIVLELNDQMCVRGAAASKVFFDNGSRRQVAI